jgi:hypothetical protein
LQNLHKKVSIKEKLSLYFNSFVQFQLIWNQQSKAAITGNANVFILIMLLFKLIPLHYCISKR